MNAYVTWSDDNKRFELHIDNTLKAYTVEPHELGKVELCKIAEDKGYRWIHYYRDK
jgi:hypothetical protein